MKTPWDFVERYHPNYDRCQEVALAQWLEIIANEGWDTDDGAEHIATCIASDLNISVESSDKWNGRQLEEVRDEARVRLDAQLKIVYEIAIEGFIEENIGSKEDLY